MSTYRPNLTPPDELRNPRWLCGCGQTASIDGPAYPICECGQRMLMVDAEGLGYVVSQESER